MRLIYPALLAPIADGGYVIKVPDVKGCVTTGEDLREALENINDALTGCICVLEDANAPIPEPSTPESIAAEGYTVVLVDIDTITYRRETDVRAVRKNVSMPAWMLYLADKRGINCSQVLQDALKKELNIAY